MLVVIPIPIIGIGYYTFFTVEGKSNNSMVYVFLLMLAFALFSFYRLTKRISDNRPILTISKSFVEINEWGKSTSYLWPQISNWEVIKDERNHFLILETSEQKKKVNISWLGKKPEEIEDWKDRFLFLSDGDGAHR